MISRRALLLSASVGLLAVQSKDVLSWPVHGLPAVPTGRSLLNFGGVSTLGDNVVFKNLFKSVNWSNNNAAGHADANGYLIDNSFTPFTGNMQVPSTYTGKYKLQWTGTAPRLQFQGYPVTIYSGTSFVVGGASFVGNNIVFFGTNGLIEFDLSMLVTGAISGTGGAVRLTVPIATAHATDKIFVQNVGGVTGASGWFNYTVFDSTHIELTGSTFGGTYTSGGSVTFAPVAMVMQWQTTDAPSGYSNLILVRSSAPYTGDLAAVVGGVATDQFNDDYLSYIRTMNPLCLRFMDQAGINNSNYSRSTDPNPTAAISYATPQWPPRLWAHNNGSGVGVISGTNTLTCAGCDETTGSFVDGEKVQGVVTNATTSLAVTGASAGASNGTGGNYIRLQMADTSSLSNGQRVEVVGYNANLGQNINLFQNGSGVWTITVIDSTHIDLISSFGGTVSVFVNAWSAGGQVFIGTLNVAGRGPKLIIAPGGDRLMTAISANTPCTFIYDALLDGWMIYQSGLGAGSSAGLSLEMRVALCNKLNKHYWHNLPHLYATDATALTTLNSVATEVAYIRDNLNSNLRCYFEVYSNEVWNQSFVQAQWGFRRGACYGFTFTNYSYNALQFRLFAQQITTTWGARGGLHCVAAASYQGVTTAITQTYLFNGTDLNGTSFPLYASAGYLNYDTAPNRPIDLCSDISYAPYYQGAVLGLTGATTSGMTTKDVTDLTGAADNWAGTGGGTQADALTWIDNDTRQGTTKTNAIGSISGGNTFNVTAHGLTNGTQVVFTLAAGASLYAGLSLNTRYYVVGAATNSYQVSATFNGSSISISGGSGTVYCGALGTQTLLYGQVNSVVSFATVAASYSPTKGIICYEGAYQATTATAAQCTTLGISTSYGATSGSGTRVIGGTIWNLLIGWKISTTFKATVKKQFDDQVSAYAGTVPGWYTNGQANAGLSNDPWSILQTDLYGLPQTLLGQPLYFQSYDAMQQFNQ